MDQTISFHKRSTFMFDTNKANKTAHKTLQDNFCSNIKFSLVLFSLSSSANNCC